ncbi:MAG: hypothetical protein ETSY1_29270 [Candidatus Entotheonella factor]|uniref:ABM domain-containing protein n=1 Tax=Entotheonella factor TaxID=1429438 RepID=W4LCG8_ENTF1|nr:antibiotic biosynthesis monooxygenase [Candidatus Entotheonella palauensis]ETW95768.1 MAG: hypothetical protein ETSY1_29270 [Candidatus Entotheonella factor]
MADMVNTPQPPYYVAIFSSTHTGHHEGYDEDTQTILNLAQQQPGFLGVEAAGGDDLSIAVTYWDSDETIRAFKALAEHLVIQEKGREKYYRNYKVRIAKVERDYGFER